MGFKCPLCLEDFGIDKDAWTTHCEEAHHGAAALAVGLITKAVEDPEADDDHVDSA